MDTHSQPILGWISTFFGSIASKQLVVVPSTSACNCLCRPSISEGGISTSIISEKCPPSIWECDSPTLPPFSVTIRVTSATMPGRSHPTVLITTVAFGGDENCRDGDVMTVLSHSCSVERDVIFCCRKICNASKGSHK